MVLDGYASGAATKNNLNFIAIILRNGPRDGETMNEFTVALDEYLRVGINHYLVKHGFIRSEETINTDVHTERRRVENLYNKSRSPAHKKDE